MEALCARDRTRGTNSHIARMGRSHSFIRRSSLRSTEGESLCAVECSRTRGGVGMNLAELQRRFSEALYTPLNSNEGIADRTLRGESMQQVTETIIKPNDRLSSTERLEIYSRSYWFRLISSLNEDFVGLRAVVGDQKFDALVQAYLTANPSRSFTLRNLGSRLESWLRANPHYIHPHEELALDMVRLEWADTECFDAAEDSAITLDDIPELGEDPQLHLQPHIQ